MNASENSIIGYDYFPFDIILGFRESQFAKLMGWMQYLRSTPYNEN